MIKTFVFIFCGLALSFQASANRVDELKTDKDVADFIVSLDSMFHAKYAPKFVVPTDQDIWAVSKIAEEEKVKNWQKVDFNNDGLTDLLVIGNWYNYTPYVAIDMGNNRFKLIRLNYGMFGKSEVARVIKQKSETLLLFYIGDRIMAGRGATIPALKIDTLIYKFDSFINYNTQATGNEFTAITFQTGPCYGSCPSFTINLLANGNLSYQGNNYAKPGGNFHANIFMSPQLKTIQDVIAYVDFKKTKDKYIVPWTDDATCTLSIKFKDGTVKTISDYGEKGTFSLRKIYAMFFDLYSNQHWLKDKY